MSRDRGQTQQDFAIGISVFLLAVLFVFAYLPSTLASSDAQIERESYTADRVATAILTNVSAEGGANQLNDTRTEQFFTWHDDGDDIRANYSISDTTQVNVTLETLDGIIVDSRDGEAGDAYLERAGAAVARIVWLDGTRYRLVVRVW
jgi:hypothetical protein